MKNRVHTIKLQLTLALIMAITLAGCKKSNLEPCREQRTAKMSFQNNTISTFDIYIDGAHRLTLQPNTHSFYLTIEEGRRHFQAIQKNPIGAPITYDNTFFVVSCDQYTWQIP